MNETSLQPVLEHAERQRDAALAALHRSEQALQQLQAQAGQLHAYRADTDARHPAHHGRAADVAMLQCHQAFSLRLQQAITQQQAQLAQAQQRVQAQREQLLALQTQVAAVRKLIERRADAGRQREAVREQRRLDDTRRRAGFGWRATTQHAAL